MAGCITHARNGHISTSALKSDVTIVFLDPISLKTQNFGDLRTFKADLGLLIFAWIFKIFWPIIGVLRVK